MSGTLGRVGTAGMRWSRLDLDEARRLYEAGLSFSQLGQRLGYCRSYLARRFKSAGIPVRPEGRAPRTPAPHVDLAEIVRRRERGQTFPAIAEALGISNDMARDRYLQAEGRERRAHERSRQK